MEFESERDAERAQKEMDWEWLGNRPINVNVRFWVNPSLPEWALLETSEENPEEASTERDLRATDTKNVQDMTEIEDMIGQGEMRETSAEEAGEWVMSTEDHLQVLLEKEALRS